MSRDEADPKSEAAWDNAYFSLILDLSEKNSSRYQAQMDKLIEEKFLELEIHGEKVRYKLDRVGCSFFVLSPEKVFERRAWNRFGWGKTSKRDALPNFFAKTEAILILKEES